jgi:threonine dehydrogenase-like Zn-dependent dehydrogenase
MKAIAVTPGAPGSIHLEEIPKPSLDEIPEGRGVLVRVLRVGVDGTDKEIVAAEYGAAPEGDDFLVIGHESLGVVEEVGPNVPDTIVPGTYVVASVRRPGSSVYGKIGLQDFTIIRPSSFNKDIAIPGSHDRSIFTSSDCTLSGETLAIK